jgi:hypothetical protein
MGCKHSTQFFVEEIIAHIFLLGGHVFCSVDLKDFNSEDNWIQRDRLDGMEIMLKKAFLEFGMEQITFRISKDELYTFRTLIITLNHLGCRDFWMKFLFFQQIFAFYLVET